MLRSWHQLVDKKCTEIAQIDYDSDSLESSDNTPDTTQLQDVLWIFEPGEPNVWREDPSDIQDSVWMFNEVPLGRPPDLKRLKRRLDKVLES